LAVEEFYCFVRSAKGAVVVSRAVVMKNLAKNHRFFARKKIRDLSEQNGQTFVIDPRYKKAVLRSFRISSCA
jgi:hypothetical protein